MHVKSSDFLSCHHSIKPPLLSGAVPILKPTSRSPSPTILLPKCLGYAPPKRPNVNH